MRAPPAPLALAANPKGCSIADVLETYFSRHVGKAAKDPEKINRVFELLLKPLYDRSEIELKWADVAVYLDTTSDKGGRRRLIGQGVSCGLGGGRNRDQHPPLPLVADSLGRGVLKLLDVPTPLSRHALLIADNKGSIAPMFPALLAAIHDVVREAKFCFP